MATPAASIFDKVPTGALAAGVVFNGWLAYVSWGRKGFWWKTLLVMSVLNIGLGGTIVAGRLTK